MVFRIVAPFDISDFSTAAAMEAIEIAKPLTAKIIFIHIVEPQPYHAPDYPAPDADRIVEDEISENAKNWYIPIAQECTARNVRSEMQVLFNRESVAGTIVSFAREMGANLIVLGHHQTHRFGNWFHENVAKDIIDRAPCPILITTNKLRLGPQ